MKKVTRKNNDFRPGKPKKMFYHATTISMVSVSPITPDNENILVLEKDSFFKVAMRFFKALVLGDLW